MGLGLFISVGKIVGVDTSIPESIMTLASALLQKNLNTDARTIEKLLDRRNPSIKEIRTAIGI